MKIAIIGGSGGLGQNLYNHINYEWDEKEFEGDSELIQCSSKQIDVTDIISCENFFHIHHPDVDVVINLAGYNYDTTIHKINQDVIDEVKRMIDVNALGLVNICAACLPGMRKRAIGRIISISSILSEKQIRGTAVYSATKAFADRFIKDVASENAKYHITANTIQLGYFNAGLTHKFDEAEQQLIKDDIPLERFGTIEELANTINWLIYNEYVTGANIKVAGGL